MALSISPRDFNYLYKLHIPIEDIMKLYECSSQMTIWQGDKNRQIEWQTTKAVTYNCFLTKEIFWKSAIKAAYNGEERVNINSPKYEHQYILFKIA